MACCLEKPSGGRHIFRPDFCTLALSEKFYARHDCLPSLSEQHEKVIVYEAEIDRVRNYDARKHYPVPRYTNQVYGWQKGECILRLERCNSEIHNNPTLQAFAKELYKQNIKDGGHDSAYCKCKDTYKKDHWKIV